MSQKATTLGLKPPSKTKHKKRMFLFWKKKPKAEDNHIDPSMSLLRTFGLSDKHIEKAIRTVVQVNDLKDIKTGKKLDGNQKAALAAEILSAEGTDWPDKAMEFLSTIVKLAWLIAKIMGKV